jgi:putative tricarboxylic transport membrane protein
MDAVKEETMKRRDRIGEIILTGLIVLVSIFLLVVTGSFPTYQSKGLAGPALWPRIILVMLILLGLIVLAGLFRKPAAKGPTHQIGAGENQERILPRVFIIMGFCVLYTLVMKSFGFLLVSLAFQILTLWVMGVRKPKSLILGPVLLTAALYGLFIRILHNPLPRGVGVFYDLSRFFY